jgi:hypothetical protein
MYMLFDTKEEHVYVFLKIRKSMCVVIESEGEHVCVV